MIIPEHRACDICGKAVYGDLPNERVRRVYFELSLGDDRRFTERIRASDVDICGGCWDEMRNEIVKRLEVKKSGR